MNKYLKISLIYFLISALSMPILHSINADSGSELIDRLNLELKQKLLREPIEIELKGASGVEAVVNIVSYITIIKKVKDTKE